MDGLSQEDQLRRDEADAVAIERLQNSSEFVNYFLRRLEEKRQSLQFEILENDKLTPEDRNTQRLLWRQLGEIIDMPGKDRAAIRSKIEASALAET